MKARITSIWCAAAWLLLAAPALADPVRQNVIWARSTNGAAITMDGVLNEAAWAAAESRVVRFGRGVDNGVPGSGYVFEGGTIPKDSTRATFKFLTNGNTLWMGVFVQDSSVGGSKTFNRMDGLLMAIKDHTSLGHPAPPAEYLYSWWYEDTTVVSDPQPPGTPPCFGGRWANPPWGSPRSPEQEAAWNAVTVVNGQTNNDAVIDNGYTIEMRFDLAVMGYDVTQPGGDIIEWNVSVYDCDWFWPLVGGRFSSNRTWWQGPWGNTSWYDEVRIFARSDVTVSSGAVPVVGPEVRVRNGAAQPTPAIDGLLNDAVWALAPSFQIKYGDDAVRNSYGNPLKWRAGQYQPPVNGGTANVVNPADATIKWFFKGNSLYLGFDVNDESVTSIPIVDRWDGFLVSINDRAIRWRDNNLESRRMAFRVGPTGQAVKEDWTVVLIDSLAGGQLAMALKANTTVDTMGFDFDEGYTAEFAIDLTKLGFPSGLGDGALWIGIDHMDGDCWTPFTDSYGTRTWWGREYEHQCCPVSAFLDPNLPVTAVDDPDMISTDFALIGNFPNPWDENTTVRFTMKVASRVTLEVFDLQGRLVSTRSLGVLQPGARTASIASRNLATGIYAYRLRMQDPGSGLSQAELHGKMMLMK
jgi:hypothetical protein